MLYVLMLYGVLCLTSSWGDTTTDTPQEPVGLTESFTSTDYLMILQDASEPVQLVSYGDW